MSVVVDDKVARLLAEKHFSAEPVNDWAIKCLEEGFDSKNLRILASMSAANAPSEYDDKLRLAFQELGWVEIHPYVYLMQYARILAQEVVNDKLDAIEGSSEMYRILRMVPDAHQELGAWYDIDEMIHSQEYFAKTGEQDYFYREKPQLVSEIKQACLDLLRRTKHNIGELPEASFEEAKSAFQEFLADNDHRSDLIWIFSEDVISDAFNVSIRTPLPEDNRELARKCFELGKQRNFGVAFHSFCTLDGRPCCYIQLPEDDIDAQYKLMGNRFIKFSCRIGMPEADAVGNSLMWQMKKLFVRNRTGFEDMIPTRATLLPSSYKK